MRKTISTVVLGGMLGLTSAALAQEDPAAERNRLMSAMWRQGLAPIMRMTREQEPFDRAAVERSFAVLADAAEKLPPLWPAGSLPANPTTRYASSPRVWESKDDFDARLAQMTRSIAENREKATTGLEGVRAAFQAVNATCDGCHQVYQIRVR